MTSRSLSLFAALSFLLLPNAQAESRPGHYKGHPADTLQQAVTNFSEYNDKLATLLAGDLTPATLSEVHQLTYTLENALQKINEEASDLTDILEEVHLASESNQPAVVKERGEAYLEVSRTLIP